jgi:hypothetical protein
VDASHFNLLSDYEIGMLCQQMIDDRKFLELSALVRTEKRIHRLCQPLLRRAKLIPEPCTQQATKGHEDIVAEFERMVQPEQIEIFIESHPDFQITDGDMDGRTILHMMISNYRPALAKYIIIHWGRQLVNRCEDNGFTPMMYLVNGFRLR